MSDTRLSAVVKEIRERAAEHRRFAGVPCQSESTWHADELDGWADRLESLLSAPPPEEAKRCCGAVSRFYGRTCERPYGHDGMHWIYGGVSAWSAPEDARPEGWQPIETAPKDGTTIIVLDGSCVEPAMWDCEEEVDGGQCWRASDPAWERIQPTHWTPLPPPPTDAKEPR